MIEPPVSAMPGPGRRFGRLSLIGAIVLGVVLVAALVIRHGKAGSTAGADRRGGPNGGPVAVAVATVTSDDIAIKLPALGTITPLATVTVKTQISGQLQQIHFQEGQLVRQGDSLAQIDPRPYQATLDQVLGNLQRDQALQSNARLDLERYRQLIAKDLLAKQQLDTQQALVQQYEGVVASDAAQVSAARLNLQYTHIVAPVSGRVGLRQVDQGNYVTPGDASGIVVITQLQPITALFPLPQDNLPAIQKRMASGDTLVVEAYDRANTTRLATGKLLTLDNVIDTSTGTVKLRALFDNKDGALFANQFVNIRLLQDVLKHQVIMPVAALQHGAPNGPNSSFVYRLNADSTVSVRPITAGAVDGERVAVSAGLSPGDVVVTEGGDRLRDGATITVPGPATPGVAPKQARKRGPGAWGPQRQP
jgi:multidrug efflux system membrane fusion protein